MDSFDREGLLYLSGSELASLNIPIDEVITSIEHLLRNRKQLKAWNAPKAVITPPDSRYMTAMISAADDPPYMAVKSLVLNPRNSVRGLSDINALVTLMNSDTGKPLAVMDGNWITAIRTAGLSAVAAQRLARSDSSVAAFIGCGVQANSHLSAFTELFPIREVRAFGRGSTNVDSLCHNAERMNCTAVACDSAQDAVRDADLIVSSVTLTRELEPFIDANWVPPGAFASMTDLGISWSTESMLAFDRIVIDDLEQEKEMQDPLVDPEQIAGDLTGLLTGELPGRRDDDERTAFVFRGLALGDLALAGLAYQYATGRRRNDTDHKV